LEGLHDSGRPVMVLWRARASRSNFAAAAIFLLGFLLDIIFFVGERIQEDATSLTGHALMPWQLPPALARRQGCRPHLPVSHAGQPCPHNPAPARRRHDALSV